jgi:uncharacterized membrane protein (TIGR02234 family)
VNARHELWAAVALAGGAAALALVAAGRPWAHATVAQGPLRLAVDPSGRAVAPAVGALALAGLAGAVAILATRSWGRLLTGVVLLVAGVGMALAAGRTASDLPGAVQAEAGRVVGQRTVVPDRVETTVWPWLAVAGGLATAAAGGLTVVRGRSWPGMSARYRAAAGRDEPPRPPEGAGGPPAESGGMWDALDRGQDPTA